MRIVCDVDCVLNNLIEIWIEVLNKTHNLNVKYEDITDYDIKNFYPTLTEEQIYAPLYEEEFWKQTQPLHNSQVVLNKIFENNHDIKIVTSTHYKNLEFKIDWLKKYYPFLHWKDIWVVHDKSRVTGDIIIDDCWDNVINFNGKRFLFNQPWNEKYKDLDLQFCITRINDWNEIENLIYKNSFCGKDKWDFECLECDNELMGKCVFRKGSK